MNSFQIIAYPLLAISAMELLLGFLLLSQKLHDSPAHRSAAAVAFFSSAYAMNTAVMYLMASRGRDFIFFARLNWIGWFAIPAGLQFIYYLRPEASRVGRTIGYIFYPFWAIVLVLCLFTDLIVSPRYSLIPYANQPGPLEVPARVAGALMILWLIIEILRTRRHLTGTKKFQLDYFFAGLLIFAFGGAAIAGILPAIGGREVEPGLGSYFGLPWVVLTFYAIVRHSLFELRIIFSRTLNIILVVLVCAALQAAMLSAIGPAIGTTLASLISLSLLGFFVFGTPISGKVQSLVNSLVIGDRYKYGELMREAIAALNAKQEKRELLDHVIETTRAALDIRDVGIYFYHAEDGCVMRQGRGLFSGMVNQRCLADIAVQKLREANRPLIRTMMEQDGPETSDIAAYMQGIGSEALVPFLFRGKLQGAMSLGRKARGEPFGQSDVEFLETLSAHAASALENARLNDITRKIRSSLQESEERFMTLAQRVPAAVFIHRGASFVHANSAAEEMTGYSRTQLMTMHLRDIVHPAYHDALTPGGPARVGPAEKEVRVVQQDGGERWAIMTSAAIEYGERETVMWILFDITEHKRTEGKLRYERIRDAVGRMASYLSADLDRMAGTIRRAAELQEYNEDGGHSELAHRVLSTVKHAEILVGILKEFGARQPTKLSLRDLNVLVKKREPILAAMLSGKCDFSIRLFPEPLRVMADPVKMERVLMSLAANARDHMPRGGDVTVAIGRAMIDAAFIRKYGYGRVGMYACIFVSDTGEGMDQAEQEQIFEPFYMTGKNWKGKGIGLSLVYDIIKEHNGYITVTSRPGQGSTFTAYLPLMP